MSKQYIPCQKHFVIRLVNKSLLFFSRGKNGTSESFTYETFDEELGCDGQFIEGIPPVNMTAISGKIACGKRGGPNFLETVRVDSVTNECPYPLVPCSKITNATDTVCVKEYERDYECPIIDLFVIHEDNSPFFEANGFQVTEGGYYQEEGDYSTKVAFSKKNARVGIGHEPIISTALNTVSPCFGAERDALVLGEKGIELLTFPLEKEFFLEQCKVEDWRKNFFVDPRFKTIGYSTFF